MFINLMIFDFLPGVLPIPYTASDQKYSSCLETHSVQCGVLKVVDPGFTSGWGFSKRLEELYNIPEKKCFHDHNPANDAYTIAHEYQVINAIQNGKITLKNK